MNGEQTTVQVDPTTNTVKNRINVGVAKSEGNRSVDHAVWVVHTTAVTPTPMPRYRAH